MRGLICLLVFASAASAEDKLVLVADPDKQAGLKEPFGLDFTSDGKIVVVEYAGHKVSQVDADGKVTTLAGSGVKGAVDGVSAKAQFNGPHNLVVAKTGEIYVADTLNNLVRKIDSKSGMVSTIAGTGKKGFSGDNGPAKNAEFNQLYHVVRQVDL